MVPSEKSRGVELSAQSGGLFNEPIAAPIAVSLDESTLLGNSLRSLSRFLDTHELRVRGEVYEAVASKVVETFEVVFVHERREVPRREA